MQAMISGMLELSRHIGARLVVVHLPYLRRGHVAPPPDEVYRGLGLDQVTLAIIWEELDGTLDKASALATS